MKNKIRILLPLLFSILASAQNNTFSPYSRYGIGEMSQRTFAHNQGMGGAFIALKPDTTMPIFINAGNPAAYALIRLTTLEVGGKFTYSRFKSAGSGLNKWGTNFSYGALGFPVGNRGGACFGLLPYSSVGYDVEQKRAETAGEMTYQYNGSGGLNKAFLGYGIMPFSGLNTRFRRRHMNLPDSLKRLSDKTIQRRDFGSKFLSEISIGANVNYLFGNIQHTARVIYPNPNLYNHTYYERVMNMGDFTGNLGAQGALIFDSVSAGNGKRRALKERVKITFGYFMSINNTMKAGFNSVAYNYIPNSSGQEIIRDTIVYNVDQQKKFALPAEQGFGIGIKKGERLNLVIDMATSAWSRLQLFDDDAYLRKNFRLGAGVNFVPDKYATGRGSFFRKLNYRVGASYESGYIAIGNTPVSDYFVSAGFGLPVGIGRLSSMVNVSAQYGRMGTTANNLTMENYWRINFGFTFCDRWFQKFRYD